MTGSIKRRQSGDFPRPDDLSVSSGDGDEDMAMEEGESGMSKAWVQEELAQSVQSPSSALPEAKRCKLTPVREDTMSEGLTPQRLAVQYHGLSGIPAGLSLIEYSRGMVAYSEEICEQALRKRARDESAAGEESDMGAAKRPSGSAWFSGAVQGLCADRARLEAQVQNTRAQSYMEMCRKTILELHGPARELEGESEGGAYLILPGVA